PRRRVRADTYRPREMPTPKTSSTPPDRRFRALCRFDFRWTAECRSAFSMWAGLVPWPAVRIIRRVRIPGGGGPRGPGGCRAVPGVNPGGRSGGSALGVSRVAAGLDEVPDRGPAVAAPPGDREPGWLEAADRDADDPLARVDAGVALGQQGYRRAG